MYLRLIKSVLCLLTVALSSGCAVQQTRVVQTEKPQTLAGQNTKPIEFAKVLFAIKDGAVVGKPHGGLACIPGPAATWRGGNSSVSEGRTVEKILSALKSHGVQIANPTDELFRSPDRQADLTLGAKVTNVDFVTCGEGTFTGRKGSATITIVWQVFSKAAGRVVLDVTTEGSFADESFKPINSASLFIDQAIGEATVNLVAKSEFRALLSAGAIAPPGRTPA